MSPVEYIKSLWETIKALPYDGGPSSTRWGYLIAVHSCCLCLLVLVLTFCLVYVRSANHAADVVFAGVITAFMGVVVGFTATSINLKNTLVAGASSAKTTPESAEPK